MLKLLFLIPLFILGCATNTPNVAVTTQVLVPDELIVDCIITPPPEVDIYLAATLKGREKILIDYSGELLNNSFICNKRLSILRHWKIETIEGINKKE